MGRCCEREVWGSVWVVGEEGGGAKKLNFGGGNFSGNIIGGELDVLGDWVWKLWIIKSYPLEFLVWNEG